MQSARVRRAVDDAGMRVHHTKTKGDLGVLYAQLDLVKKGYWILLPQTEHAPFDLVAYRAGLFLRVQVKYRAAKSGVITLPFKYSWADQRGCHSGLVDKTAIDVYAVYCPDADECYYVDPRAHRACVCLRLVPTRNNVARGVLWARDFRDIPESVIARAQRVVTEADVRQSSECDDVVERP